MWLKSEQTVPISDITLNCLKFEQKCLDFRNLMCLKTLSTKVQVSDIYCTRLILEFEAVKIPQNLDLIIRFLKSAHFKRPFKNPLNFFQASCTKICPKICQIYQWKLENSNLRTFSEILLILPILWQKIWTFCCSYLDKILRIFPRNFDTNTFSKNLRNFQKSDNFV